MTWGVEPVPRPRGVQGYRCRWEEGGLGRGVSIAEVAARAGVGVGTVSRVLNGHARVSDATRERVLEVIERLDYRPSRLAAGLSRGRTGSVAVLVPFVTRPSVVARLAGVLAVLTAEGIDSVVCDIETADQRDRRLEALTQRHSVDGIVSVSLPLPRRYVMRLQDRHIPLAAVDADIAHVPRVLVDDVAGGRMATEHLLGLGHSRIGFIGDERDRGLGFTSTARRLSGYRRALRAAGVEPDPRLVRSGPHGAEPAAAMAMEMLRSAEPPTAVFTASDTQAMGVLRAAEQMGLSVPGDLSVIGFDDIEAAGMLRLSTVRQPLRESGVIGARMVCALIGRGGRPAAREMLPLEVVVRASTARLRRERAPATTALQATALPPGPGPGAGSPQISSGKTERVQLEKAEL